jgi:hypothetical protein
MLYRSSRPGGLGKVAGTYAVCLVTLAVVLALYARVWPTLVCLLGAWIIARRVR